MPQPDKYGQRSRHGPRVLWSAYPFAILLVVLCAGTSEAQERLTRLSLEEAVDMTTRDNPTLRAKQFEYQAIRANEITAGLRPNPTGNFLAEKFGGGSASQTQYTFSMGSRSRSGASGSAVSTVLGRRRG
jgi:outer membrane protein TolC